MVSTRKASQDQPAQADARIIDDVKQETTFSPSPSPSNSPSPVSSLSPLRKRHADANEDQPAEKRRQLTPVGEHFTVPNTTGSQHSNENTRANGVSVDQDARNKLETSAQELLKLYACTKSFEYLSAILSRPTSRKGKLYKLQYERFQRQRTAFPTRDNFIAPTSLEAGVKAQRFARCINFVTFAASMLGSRDASFSQLNDHFFEVFIDKTGGRTGHLLKLQADILLGLKTQAYIAQAAEKGTLQEQLLGELFPSDMSQRLLALQPDSGSARLASSEQTFVKQSVMRKRLLAKKVTADTITALREEYRWNDVLKNMLAYLKQHFEEIAQKSSDDIRSMNDDGEREEDVRVEMPQPPPPPLTTSAPPTERSTNAARATTASQPSTEPSVKTETQALQVPNLELTQSKPTEVQSSSQEVSGLDTGDEIFMKAMQAANAAMSGTAVDVPYVPPDSAAPGNRASPYGFQQQIPNYANSFTAAPSLQTSTNPSSPLTNAKQSQFNTNQQGLVLAPNGQSHPTHQLYEMAREASTGRPAQQQPPRRQGSQSQRRPWTPEEEKALLDGLDQVKGPHWSMILQLYGPGGKISEVLKDRNQVQLKDKARNLKLWFLKSGGEVPVNLRSVTGELKTRAPAAIRNAAAAAAAAAQVQPNGASGPTIGSHGLAPNHLDPNQSPYAPANMGAYSAAAATNTAPATTPTMSTAGPQDASFPMADSGINFDSWNDAADAAAAQVIKDLQAELGLNTDITGAVVPNGTIEPSVEIEAAATTTITTAAEVEAALQGEHVGQENAMDDITGAMDLADDPIAAAAAAAAADALNAEEASLA